MLRQFVNGFVGKALNKMSITYVVKTVDPRYTEAKRKFSLFGDKIETILGQVLQLQERLTALSASAVSLSETALLMCPHADRAPELEALSASSQNLSVYTTATFSQEVETSVISPLCQRQAEAARVPDLRRSARASRRAFDEQRAVVAMLRNQRADLAAIHKEEAKLRDLRERYAADLAEFCGCVERLAETEADAIAAAANAMAAAIARYAAHAIEAARALRPDHGEGE